MSGGMILKATLGWLVPVRLLRVQPVYSAASILLHIGILLVPLFAAGHLAVWLPPSVALWWPVLSARVADGLAVLSMAALVILLLGRITVQTARELTQAGDNLILLVLLGLVGTGYWAAHPASAPGDPRAMLLIHQLLGNLGLVLTPTTKIVHCVLNPFSQLIAELSWRFPAATGEHVSIALGKENDSV
jgi:hypothetical protein